MLLTLPVLTGVLIGLALWRLRPAVDWREHLLGAALALGLLTVVFAEGLSLAQALGPSGVAFSWAGVTVGAALLVGATWQGWPAPGRDRRPTRAELVDGLIFLGPSAAIVVATGLIAVVGWPNNSDGMVYHLPRIVYWLQQGSVEVYPTNLTRQLFSLPWTEYAQLQAMVLAGDERAANLIQWGCLLGCLVGVSLIAQRLGAGRRGQLGAVLFCATLPMGILQASSVQNDYALAFWLVCLTAALLSCPGAPLGRGEQLAAGASFGLALLTKGTTYFYLLPLLPVVLLGRAWTGLRRLIVAGAVVGGLGLLIALPFHWRNLNTFGSLLGPLARGPDDSSVHGVTNQRLDLGVLLSNLVRNVALHLGSPLPGADSAVARAIGAAHQAVGLGVSDPRTTYRSLPFAVPPVMPDEGFAGNTLHLLLIVVALAFLAAGWRRAGRPTLTLTLALLLSFGLFSLLLKWQPFSSRLQLPAFVLWAPLVGKVLLDRPGRLPLLLVLPLVIWSWPFVLENRSHPLLGANSVWTTERVDQYFYWRRTDQAPTMGAVRYVQERGCREVGLLLDWNDYEYPALMLLKGVPWSRAVQVRPVGVVNPGLVGLVARTPGFEACAAIDLRDGPAAALTFDGRTYQPAWAAGRVRVLVPLPSSTSSP